MHQSPSTSASAAGFPVFQKWSLYQTVVRENLMRHREVSSAIRQRLSDRKVPVRVVDAGCGDGQLARMSLTGVPLRSYVGIDLSQPALDEALTNTFPGMRFDGCPVELRCGDLRDGVLAIPAASVDVLLAGYSLHHLQDQDKQDWLSDVTRVLAPHGEFLWADIVRQPGQSRDAYLAALEHSIRVQWTVLTADQIEDVVSHILSSDYPETADWMLAATSRAGLSTAQELYRDEYFGVWCFSK